MWKELHQWPKLTKLHSLNYLPSLTFKDVRVKSVKDTVSVSVGHWWWIFLRVYMCICVYYTDHAMWIVEIYLPWLPSTATYPSSGAHHLQHTRPSCCAQTWRLWERNSYQLYDGFDVYYVKKSVSFSSKITLQVIIFCSDSSNLNIIVPSWRQFKILTILFVRLSA